MDNKICETVEIVARNDTEAYVKASALRVLASMIKIQELWKHSLYLLDVKVRLNFLKCFYAITIIHLNFFFFSEICNGNTWC
jgi:hypothetical protein